MYQDEENLPIVVRVERFDSSGQPFQVDPTASWAAYYSTPNMPSYAAGSGTNARQGLSTRFFPQWHFPRELFLIRHAAAALSRTRWSTGLSRSRCSRASQPRSASRGGT